jgi:hypothetical protein
MTDQDDFSWNVIASPEAPPPRVIADPVSGLKGNFGSVLK